ncbi:hypothetical protein CC117_07545 [Parafrankia colletiae]|uniref:Fido domain-containing protein n=1 Tax=Parafrankia colletiae TaxID=573497 RepID=A0A1S1Q6M5_9ACTN|nr:hypothetical protein [Parafrankia colletiae]MCK9902263.1 hypothetical protein [Frankia sp. Cpl3]OHV29229.1 hypothetical protein CC117_07545 [Parafrankia colletiae]
MTARSAVPVAAADPLSQVAAIPGVGDAATAARASVDTLLRHRILRRRSAEVTAEASLRAARASAALEGHDVPLDVLRAHLGDQLPAGEATSGAAVGPAGSAGADAGADAENLGVTLGAVRLYAELGTLAPAWERAPRQALARMHLLAGRGLLPDTVLGRPRTASSDAVAGGRAVAGGGEPVFAGGLGLPTVSALEMSARLDGLTAVLTAPTAAPAIVVAAVVHGELLAIRPFGALDGIIARAAARLVLISRGLDPKALVATDVGHLELDRPAGGTGTDDGDEPAGAYSAALAAYLAGGPDGVGTWVRHCATAVGLAARESLAVCEALSRG